MNGLKLWATRLPLEKCISTPMKDFSQKVTVLVLPRMKIDVEVEVKSK